MTSSTRGVFTILQLTLTVALTVIGEQLLNTTEISHSSLIIFIILIMIGLIILERRQESRAMGSNSTVIEAPQVVAIGIIAGLFSAWILIFIFGEDGSATRFSAHLYEWGALVMGVVLALTIAVLRDQQTAMSFALGFGVGMPAAIMLIRPEENIAIATWIGNFLSVVLLSYFAIKMKDLVFRP